MAATQVRICVLGFLCFFAFASVQQVTPVEKVIELLKKLSAKVEEDGKNEAVEYDKFACFCKNHAGSKNNAVEKSTEKIAVLDANIDSLEASIGELNTAIGELNTRLGELETEIETETAVRAKEHAAYVVQEKDMSNAIAALKQAIKAMQDSKGGMQDAKLYLTQLKPGLKKIIAEIAQRSSVRKAQQLVSFMQQPGKPDTANAYTYQSNDIIATLQGLLSDFRDNKKELDETEINAKLASDKRVLDLQNEKTFKEKEKAQKEAIVGAKTEDLNTAEQDKTAETKAMDADNAFLGELESQCEARAAEFDERSKARASEMTAISQALEHLEGSVATNYGANKKLVALAKHQTVTAPATTKLSGKAAPSLLQIRAANSGAAAVQHALQVINSAAGKLNSAVLSAVMTQAVLQEDHFVKVRGLIKDLIARLESDAEAEATTKSFCDTEMAKETSARDDASLTIETETATISEKTAEKKQLLEEIAVLSKEIAETQKALNEATELRANEKANNEKTIADANAGKVAVDEAISILQGFYGTGNGASFVQASAAAGYTPYVAEGSDRHGQTVGDYAPSKSLGEYEGRQGEASGIIGILQVISADFDRTVSTVTQAEADAVTKFNTFKTESEQLISDKTTEKTDKETEVTNCDEAIATAETNLKDAQDLKEAALKALQDLSAMCVAGEETYAERKEKREQEIEALKAAMKILDEWQS